MKISSVNFLNIKNAGKIQNKNNIRFCATNSLIRDTFEKSSKAAKTVTIKDIKGNSVPAVIKEEFYKDDSGFFGTNPKKLSIKVDGKELGYTIMYDSKKGDELYVKELYTEEIFRRHYKGAGSELLKCLIEESKKRGYKGKIGLTASNVPPPFVFYYKNNFDIVSKNPQYIAAVDYAARNNVPVSKLLPEGVSALTMRLNEEGANAVLEGKRLYEKKPSFTIAKTKICDMEFVANYTQAKDDGEFYFQVINKNADKRQQIWFAAGKIVENQNKEKIMQLFPMNDNFYTVKKIQEFAKESIEIFSKKLCIDKVEIIEEDF